MLLQVPPHPETVATTSITRVKSQHAPREQVHSMTQEEITYVPSRNPMTMCGSGFQNYCIKEHGMPHHVKLIDIVHLLEIPD